MIQYSSKPYQRYSGNVKIELEVINYATKADLKRATDVDTSNSAGK